MNSNDWQRVEQLFQHAITLDEAARERYLERECMGDERLRARVQSLLKQDSAPGDPVEASIGRAAQDVLDTQAMSLLGTRLGAWKLRQQIARGGMGAVYLAERADGHFQQRAALKVLNPALLSAEALGRFNSERQILARLSHPNIARLIDGGTTEDGIPFLVMELIEGDPVDVYCRRHSLSIEARLRLLAKVCAAADYAHKNLVVHRDIKPSNVLVDAHGEPKLLDFGVAKLIDRDSLHAASITVADLRLMTPRYASPEQIKGEPVTTATDVYSLGVLMYELLVGRFPYRDAETSAADLHRAICESEPERPSTAVTREDAEPHSGLSAARVSRLLTGDLDNIALMALRKEPGRRYGSPLQLMEDIERYLRNEPVRARRNRWSYRARKFVARHKAGVVSSVGAAALIVAIVAFYTMQLAAQRDRAQLEERKAREVSEFLTGLFREADPDQALGKDVTARVLLERGAERAATELKGTPRVQAAMMSAIAQSYANMAEFPAALRQAEGALQIERTLGPDEDRARNETKLLRGRVLAELGRYAEAAKQLGAVHDYAVTHYGAHSLQAATSERELAHLDYVGAKYGNAVDRYKLVIADLRTLGTPARRDLAKTLDDYATLTREMGRLSEAEVALRESLSIKRAEFGEVHPEIVSAYSSLGNLYQAKGEGRASIEFLNKAFTVGRAIFGVDSLRVARIQANRGNAEYYVGQFAQSERDSRAALAVFRRVLGEDHPHVAFLMGNLANALMEEGRAAEALEIYENNVAKLSRIFGAEHLEVGRSLTNEAGALLDLGRYREAAEVLRKAEPIVRGNLGDDQIEVVRLSAKLADAAAGLAHYEEAEQGYRHAIDAIHALYKNAPNSDEARAWASLGAVLRKAGKPAQAEQALRNSLVVWARVNELSENREAAETRAELGRALLDEKRREQGIEELSAAHAWLRAHVETDDAALSKVAADLHAAQAAR